MSMAPRIGLLLGTLVCVLLLAEGMARLLERSAARGAPPPERAPELEGLPRLEGVLGFAEPNVRGVHLGVLYRTNSLGLRGPEYALEPPPGTFRILIAGDSVTAGWGVEEEDAYPVRLAAMLKEDPPEAAPGVRFEVINLGLPGVNAEFSARRLARFAETYDADLLIYGFTTNDINGPHYRKRERPGSLSDHELAVRMGRFRDSPSGLVRVLWPRIVLLLEQEAFEAARRERLAHGEAELRENYFENPDAWNDFALAIERVSHVARSRQVCGHVLLHTHLSQLGEGHAYHDIYRRVAETARSQGLTVTETYPSFASRDETGLWVHPFDVHPNAEGHSLLAEALYKRLLELPASCWVRRR